MDTTLYNYVTGEYDTSIWLLTSDEKAKQCMPQIPRVRFLYDLYRELGDDIPTALERTLHAALHVFRDID